MCVRTAFHPYCTVLYRLVIVDTLQQAAVGAMLRSSPVEGDTVQHATVCIVLYCIVL